MTHSTYNGIYIAHRIVDAASKEAAVQSLMGWEQAELTPHEWLQKLDQGNTIQLSKFEPTPEGIFTHKKKFWRSTYFVFTDADNIRGVEYDKDGNDVNPAGVEYWTEKDGLSKRFPKLSEKAYAVSQSVSSMSDEKPPPHRRYRIVFCFNKPIESEEHYHYILITLAKEFPIIPSIERSPAQPVFGNAREGFDFHICGNILSLEDYPLPEPEPEPEVPSKPSKSAPDETLEEFLRRHNISYTPTDTPNKFYVTCPYQAQHASGKNTPTDAYVFDDRQAWAFHCSHTTCKQSGRSTWDAFKVGHGITTKVFKQAENGKYEYEEPMPVLEPVLENPLPVFPDGVFVGGFENILKAYKDSRVCKSFIFAMGITAVGVTTGRKAFLTTEEDTRASAPDYPNTYNLIVGPTTVAAKSETRSLLEGILEFVHTQDVISTPYCYINSVSSREGLAIDLRTDGGSEEEFQWESGMFPEGVRALVSLDETKHLLDNARREVTKNIVSDFNDLWRCPTSNNVRTRQFPIRVDFPVVSIFGCSTIKWLEEAVVGSDIDGGFINRFMPFLYERMPYIRKPKVDIDAYSDFVKKVSELLPTPESARHFLFTEEAYEAYHEWAEPLYNHAVEYPEDAAITARTCDHARRIALCLSLISNEAKDNKISLDILTAAQKVAEYLADVARYIFKNVTAGKDAQIERKTLDLLAQMGNEAKASELLQKFTSRDRPPAKIFHQIIDGLVFSGIVEVILTKPKVIRRIG